MSGQKANLPRTLRNRVLWLFATLALAPFLVASLVQYRQAALDGGRAVVEVAEVITSRTVSEARRVYGEAAMDAQRLAGSVVAGATRESWEPLSPSSVQRIDIRDESGALRRSWRRSEPSTAIVCARHGVREPFRFSVEIPGSGREGSLWTAEIIPDLSTALVSDWTGGGSGDAVRVRVADGDRGFLTNGECDQAIAGSTLVPPLGVDRPFTSAEVYRSQKTMTEAPWTVEAYLSQEALGFHSGSVWFFLLTVVAGTLATLLFGMSLAGVTKSLEQLANAADQIGEGEFSPWLPPPGNDEAGRLSYAIGRMMDRIRDMLETEKRSGQMAAVGEMASYVAHEIRNPLNSLRLNLQSVERSADLGALEADDHESLAICLREVTRLDRVVSGVLRFTKPSPTDVDLTSLHGVLLEAVALLGEELDRRSVEATLELTADEDWIRADAQQIEAAVINLMLNSAEAMKNGGSVVITTRNVNRAGRSAIELLVTDTGPGIPLQLRPRVFDPFFTTKPSGSGLGLAVVMRTVEEHGGLIELEEPTGLDRGATFRIVFPTLGQETERPESRRWKTPIHAVRRFLRWRNNQPDSESRPTMTGMERPS